MGKRSTRTCPKPTSSHNLEFLIWAHVLGCILTLNNPTKQVYTNTLKRPTWMSLQGHCQTTRPKDPPEQVYMNALKRPAWTSLHGRLQMTFQNEFTWVPTWLKWKHKGEPGKRAAWTCIKPTLGHNLALLIGAHVLGHAPTLNDPIEWVYTNALKRPTRKSLHWHPRMTRPNEFTEMTSNDFPEWVYMDALKWPARMSLHGHPHDQNEGTRESWTNELDECAQSPPRVLT